MFILLTIRKLYLLTESESIVNLFQAAPNQFSSFITIHLSQVFTLDQLVTHSKKLPLKNNHS